MRKGMLDVVYEDRDLLIINKYAGVTVNRSETTKDMTLQDLIEKYLKLPENPYQKSADFEQKTPEQNFIDRSGVVHRLDKETSGIILIAKNVQAFTLLQKEFHDRVVKKAYLALAHGNILPKSGIINVPVGRLNYNRTHFGVVAGGRESVTSYKVLRTYTNPLTNETLSFVELCPKSGRTHQIRVHLKYMGYPIFGDELYAGRKTARNDRKILPRVFLHAAEITFIHPMTQKEMHFTTPLPKELDDLISRQLI